MKTEKKEMHKSSEVFARMHRNEFEVCVCVCVHVYVYVCVLCIFYVFILPLSLSALRWHLLVGFLVAFPIVTSALQNQSTQKEKERKRERMEKIE